MRFEVFLMRTVDGGFQAVVPAMSRWFSSGDSETEVLEKARAAINESVEDPKLEEPDISLVVRRLRPGP